MTNGSWATTAGYVAGGAVAPLAAAGSRARGSRLFHPAGVTLRGHARAARRSGALAVVGERLEGLVGVRLSGAWWKRRQWPDVLGCALRFTRREEPGPEPGDDDQDLLLATVRHPLTTIVAAATTNVRDFLANDYFGVAPFQVPPLGRVKLRLRPHREPATATRRDEKLSEVLARGPVTMVLQARMHRLGSRYESIAVITLDRAWDVDEDALRFDPFRTGRELIPVGFVHHTRRLAYAASQAARSARSAPGLVRRPRLVLLR